MMSELFDRNRIFVFAGHFGSGKTEIAVNFAFALAEEGNKTAIVDLDIINPYFRTTDAHETLLNAGIRVVAPLFANTNVDVPALPAEINTLFENRSYKAVFDIGGDNLGAKAVSRYRDDFIAQKTACFFVYNLRRPMTTNVAEIVEMFDDIQKSSRVPFTAIVNNTNLLSYTTDKDLLDGLEAGLLLSKRLSLPLAFSAFLGSDTTLASKSVNGKHWSQISADMGHEQFFERSKTLGVPVLRLDKHIRMDVFGRSQPRNSN